MKIGIVGYSHNEIDSERAYHLLLSGIKFFAAQCENNETIEIVSGLTNLGIPKIAYRIADEHKYTTVGITARRALNSNFELYPVDKQIIKGKEFGDESVFFIEYIDCLIRIGGGKQSLNEVNLFSERMLKQKKPLNIMLYESELS